MFSHSLLFLYCTVPFSTNHTAHATVLRLNHECIQYTAETETDAVFCCSVEYIPFTPLKLAFHASFSPMRIPVTERHTEGEGYHVPTIKVLLFHSSFAGVSWRERNCSSLKTGVKLVRTRPPFIEGAAFHC